MPEPRITGATHFTVAPQNFPNVPGSSYQGYPQYGDPNVKIRNVVKFTGTDLYPPFYFEPNPFAPNSAPYDTTLDRRLTYITVSGMPYPIVGRSSDGTYFLVAVGSDGFVRPIRNDLGHSMDYLYRTDDAYPALKGHLRVKAADIGKGNEYDPFGTTWATPSSTGPARRASVSRVTARRASQWPRGRKLSR